MARPEEDVRFDFLTLFQFENRGIDRSIVELVDDAEARFIELISRDNRAEGRGWKSNGQSFWQQPVLETYIHTLHLHTVPRRCWSIFKHEHELSRVKLRLDASACFSTSLLLIQRKFSTRKCGDTSSLRSYLSGNKSCSCFNCILQ